MLIYNTLGQEVYNVEMPRILVGANEFTTVIPPLAAGVYYYRLITSQKPTHSTIRGSLVIK